MKGKQLSGKARAIALTPEKRKQIAIKASNARSLDKNFNVTHGSENSVLKLGKIEIPCFVLKNGQRILFQHNMATALDVTDTGGKRIVEFTGRKFLSEFIDNEILE